MAGTITISGLESAADVAITDLVEVSVENALTETGYESFKNTLGNIADAFINSFTYSAYKTTVKTVTGALNELYDAHNTVLSATLTAGSKTLTFTDNSIKATSKLQLMINADIDGYKSVSSSANNSVTFEFWDIFDTDMTFKLRVINV